VWEKKLRTRFDLIATRMMPRPGIPAFFLLMMLAGSGLHWPASTRDGVAGSLAASDAVASRSSVRTLPLILGGIPASAFGDWESGS